MAVNFDAVQGDLWRDSGCERVCWSCSEADSFRPEVDALENREREDDRLSFFRAGSGRTDGEEGVRCRFRCARRDASSEFGWRAGSWVLRRYERAT